jgi:hypothetical protein
VRLELQERLGIKKPIEKRELDDLMMFFSRRWVEVDLPSLKYFPGTTVEEQLANSVKRMPTATAFFNDYVLNAD